VRRRSPSSSPAPRARQWPLLPAPLSRLPRPLPWTCARCCTAATRALGRAQELRAAAKQTSGDALRELVDEVCDLVALALEPSP